jgi:glycosyltransferase involved in cell wall biosynthesis
MTAKTYKRKLKIALFHCAFVYSGGGERIALEATLGLRKAGHSVDLYSPATDWKNCFPDLLRTAKPKEIIPQFPPGFPLRDGLNMLFASLLAPFVVQKFAHYDVYIGENQPGVWFAYLFAKIFRKPYVIYLNQPNRMIYPRAIDVKTGWRTNTSFVFLEKAIALARPIVATLDKISIQRANFMAVNGHYIGDIISQIYGKDYITCPAGCDPFPHGTLRFEKKRYYSGTLQVNGFRIEKPYIFLSNRHYPQKRFDYAIEALPLVLKKFPTVKLVISGAFTSSTNLWRALAEKLGVSESIIWLGEVSNLDMGKLYEHACVYVYTSPEEDYGMGVVEAEEFGVPVVAWNHAGPTVTVVSAKTGFLVKPYEVKEFARSISWLLEHPNERVAMGKLAHSHVQKHFTWKRHVEILENTLYKSVVGELL